MILSLSLTELRRHRLRTGLTILGIVIGILLLVALGSLGAGLQKSMNDTLSLISGTVTVADEGASGFENYGSGEVDENLVDELGGLDGVEKAAPAVFGQVPGFGGIWGFNAGDLDIFTLDIGFREGDMYEDGEYQIVPGYKMAEERGYVVGDEIEIRGKRLSVVGILDSTGSAEIDNVASMPLEVAQELTNMKNKVSMIMVKPSNIEEASSIAQTINEGLDGVVASTSEDVRKEAEKFIGSLNVMTLAMGSIAAIIAAIGITNVMYMSVRERRREIGTMKALGATTWNVLSQVISEAILIAMIGAVGGIILGSLSVGMVNSFLPFPFAEVTPGLVLEALVFALALGIIGGVLPARQAAKLDPAVVLRSE